ncbi:MAG TPA: helix-hairpin-helix domain-containing protein [Streptosporangiaceae bacterium]|nr:helix-hairpin-helix domain-containing protein [Streptosporangiaceae bacterium]
MPPRDPRKSAPADRAGDDFQKIQGIGAGIERRLHEAGILTYQDLAALTPEQTAASLSGMAGLSPARIASQDWAGQAAKLAGPAAPSLPSEPDQHYASFHIELLLDVDNSVRRTKVRHHQSGTDEAWAGWDEDRLLTLLREHIPPEVQPQPAEAGDLQSSGTPTAAEPDAAVPAQDQPEKPIPPGDQPETGRLPAGLPSSSLRVEHLGLTRAGQRSRNWAPGEPTSVGFTLRVSRAGTAGAGNLDFTADVTAGSVLGDDQHWPLGTVRGAVQVDEPLSVELTGEPLPRGLYRPEATVLIYPANHDPDSQPLQGRRASGALIQVG